MCISKTRRMPEQLVTFGDVKKAADRTLKEMGINPQDEWRSYSFSDAGDDLALS
ncbi:PerC family transcriptional regulator [Escherichia coli]|nr:PerC family transcriptional regulator [Escherichia coli]EKL0132709.1 PerC family transcriptional regulator [Escherichia coli]